MFSSFICDDDVKPNFIIRIRDKVQPIEQAPRNDTNTIKSDLQDIRDLMGNQFATLVQEVHIINDKILEIDKRMKRIESITDTTVEELISYFLTILQNLDNDDRAAKKNLMEDIGKNAALDLINQMEKVMQTHACDPAIKERVLRVKVLLED